MSKTRRGCRRGESRNDSELIPVISRLVDCRNYNKWKRGRQCPFRRHCRPPAGSPVVAFNLGLLCGANRASGRDNASFQTRPPSLSGSRSDIWPFASICFIIQTSLKREGAVELYGDNGGPCENMTQRACEWSRTPPNIPPRHSRPVPREPA